MEIIDPPKLVIGVREVLDAAEGRVKNETEKV
jgi:hypothetical protein